MDNRAHYDNYSTNNMDLSYKAIMSILDDSLKQIICPLLPSKYKYGPILWLYVICEVRTVLFQQIKSLKKKLETLKLHQIPGGNVKVFTSQFLQTCLVKNNFLARFSSGFIFGFTLGICGPFSSLGGQCFCCVCPSVGIPLTLIASTIKQNSNQSYTGCTNAQNSSSLYCGYPLPFVVFQ